jgi:hypothetical protein
MEAGPTSVFLMSRWCDCSSSTARVCESSERFQSSINVKASSQWPNSTQRSAEQATERRETHLFPGELLAQVPHIALGPLGCALQLLLPLSLRLQLTLRRFSRTEARSAKLDRGSSKHARKRRSTHALAPIANAVARRMAGFDSNQATSGTVRRTALTHPALRELGLQPLLVAVFAAHLLKRRRHAVALQERIEQVG